jgi:hypothetical protein
MQCSKAAVIAAPFTLRATEAILGCCSCFARPPAGPPSPPTHEPGRLAAESNYHVGIHQQKRIQHNKLQYGTLGSGEWGRRKGGCLCVASGEGMRVCVGGQPPRRDNDPDPQPHWQHGMQATMHAPAEGHGRIAARRSLHSQPREKEDLPPGAACTRVVGRSVMVLPQFWLEPLAKELEDTADRAPNTTSAHGGRRETQQSEEGKVQCRHHTTVKARACKAEAQPRQLHATVTTAKLTSCDTIPSTQYMRAAACRASPPRRAAKLNMRAVTQGALLPRPTHAPFSGHNPPPLPSTPGPAASPHSATRGPSPTLHARSGGCG